MARDHQSEPCRRRPGPKEIWRDEAGLDACEHTLLTCSRFYFQSFAEPASQGWLRALSTTDAFFGVQQGPIVAVRLLTAMQAMRLRRRSIFQFSHPQCAHCAEVLTEHERRFMTALKASRCGDTATAQLELMMLCEGADTTDVQAALIDLATVLTSPTPAKKEMRYVADFC
jgi:hypothetical protein